MMKVHKFGPDTRASVIDMGTGAHVALCSGGHRLVMLIPLPVVNTLAVELEACRRGAERAAPPAPPPFFKWPQLVDRLNRNALTPGDRDVLRDVLHRMGVPTA